MTYAQWQFWASGYDKDSKVSRIENLRQVEKTLGRKPKELQAAPVLRDELAYLWLMFVRLKNASGEAISYTHIKDYMEMFGELTLFEIDTIVELDQAQRVEANKNG